MGRRRSRSIPPPDFKSLRGQRTRAYIRESTVRQAEADRFGPDVQRAGIQAFCEKQGLELPQAEYFDKVSGRSVEGRTELARAEADAGDYEVLLFFDTSRSFRNREDASTWKPRLRRKGLTLIFVNQEIISGNPETKVVEGFHEVMDEYRSDEQARFVRMGLRQKYERGLHNGAAPLGYRRFRGSTGDRRNGELETVPQEATTVLRAFELYAGGRYSERDVALTLNAELSDDGRPVHRTKRGTPLTEGGVGEMLGNRVYLGFVVWHPFTDEEEVRPGRHAPVISQELFDAVQRTKAERVHWRGRRSVARTYPLSRRALCFDCGASVAGDTGGKGNHRRMRHARTGTCGWRSQSARHLEGQMGGFLAAGFTLPKDWERKVTALLAKPEKSGQTASEGEVQRLHGVLERLRQQHKWGDISDAEYRAECEEIERRIADAAPPPATPIAIPDLRRAARMLRDVGALFNHPGVTGERRKEFIEEVFESVQLDEHGIRAVLPAEEYRPLVAVAQVGGNGAGDRVRTGTLCVRSRGSGYARGERVHRIIISLTSAYSRRLPHSEAAGECIRGRCRRTNRAR